MRLTSWYVHCIKLAVNIEAVEVESSVREDPGTTYLKVVSGFFPRLLIPLAIPPVSDHYDFLTVLVLN